MITKERTISLAIIVVIAAMFVSSTTIMSPVLAKSKDKTSSVKTDYKEFQKCLTNVVGSKGFASKVEIRDCFNPIYSPNSNQSTIDSQGNGQSNLQSPQGNGQSNLQSPQGNSPSGIDFSSPQITHH